MNAFLDRHSRLATARSSLGYQGGHLASGGRIIRNDSLAWHCVPSIPVPIPGYRC
jgi:hypothetical protein